MRALHRYRLFTHHLAQKVVPIELWPIPPMAVTSRVVGRIQGRSLGVGPVEHQWLAVRQESLGHLGHVGDPVLDHTRFLGFRQSLAYEGCKAPLAVLDVATPDHEYQGLAALVR